MYSLSRFPGLMKEKQNSCLKEEEEEEEKDRKGRMRRKRERSSSIVSLVLRYVSQTCIRFGGGLGGGRA